MCFVLTFRRVLKNVFNTFLKKISFKVCCEIVTLQVTVVTSMTSLVVAGQFSDADESDTGGDVVTQQPQVTNKSDPPSSIPNPQVDKSDEDSYHYQEEYDEDYSDDDDFSDYEDYR